MKRILLYIICVVGFAFNAEAQILQYFSPYYGDIYNTYQISEIDSIVPYGPKIDKEKERAALIAIYNALGGDNWANNTNWCSDKPVNEWFGVWCNEVGSVIGLSLSMNNLRGQLPEEIGDLLNLTDIFMSTVYGENQNIITGPIPESIGKLSNLRVLELAQNRISGKLPESMKNLHKLESLNLHGAINFENGEFLDYEYLTGEIPEWIGDLTELSFLDLSCNHLSGRLPKSFSKLVNLSVLMINANDLTGEIPKGLSGMKNLRYLYINGNYFTGTLPKDFGELLDNPNLTSVYIGSNQLTGKIPDDVVKSLRFPDFAGAILSRQLPGYGFDLSDLKIPAVKRTYPLIDGSGYVNLAKEYSQKDYTLLFRWAEWCPNSNQILPVIKEISERYRDDSFQIIGAYGGGNYADRDAFIKEKGIDGWRHVKELIHDTENLYYSDEEHPIWLSWLGYGIPHIEVVDREGNIVFLSDDSGIYPDLPVAHKRNEILQFFADNLGEGTPPDYYTSTDYSKDGEVITLQKATVGKGIDLVFMGEGFTDQHMDTDGLYEQKMRQAVEQFFSQEPYASFRDRFNVYAVKVVSPNAEFAYGAKHALNEYDGKCFEYASKVPGINQNQMMVTVVYNAEYAGRSYCTMYGDGSFVAYIMEETRPEVINHEVGGHGFSKLLDEYVEPGYETFVLGDDAKQYLDDVWRDLGWGANVDHRDNPAEVKWAQLLADPRYAGELGIYEGAYLFGHGAYRPTENSMMRYNDSPFNAPSREAIYKKIMRESEGESWVYDYEEFVAYDALNRGKAPMKAPSKDQIKRMDTQHRKPVLVKGSWRDAIKTAGTTYLEKK